MTTTEYLIAISLCYGFLLFLDRFFKSCSMYPYITFLSNTGLEINFFNINWHTTAFNRLLFKIRTKHKNFFETWYNTGVYFSLVLFPISLILLAYSLLQLIFPSNSQSAVIIEPIIPGVTFPLDEIIYYSIALGISSLVHELGHAIAALEEDVHIFEMGFRVYFIMPLAFVLISNDELNILTNWKKLKILCAGIWHNVILALIAYLIYLSSPVLLTLLFEINKGVYVKDISRSSPLLGAKGLEIGDVLYKINDYQILNDNTFLDGLIKVLNNKDIGYCVQTDFVHALDESVHLSSDLIDCCDPNNKFNLCFEYLDQNDGIVNLPPHLCLPARKIIEHSYFACTNEPCPLDLHCIRPMLKNSTYLMRIDRMNKTPVIYVGHPGDVYKTIKVSSYIPKINWLSSNLADNFMEMLIYLTVFSFGLAIVNVLPCWFLDGQHIVTVLVQIFLADRIKSILTRQMITLCFVTLGTFLLISCVIGAILTRYWV